MHEKQQAFLNCVTYEEQHYGYTSSEHSHFWIVRCTYTNYLIHMEKSVLQAGQNISKSKHFRSMFVKMQELYIPTS